MQIYIRQNHIHHSEALDNYIQRRLHFALGRFAHKIQSITIRLMDINGPRGGADKMCKMILKMKDKLIPMEGLGSDFYAVVDSTTDRLRRQVQREVDRAKNNRHVHKAQLLNQEQILYY